MRVRTVGPELHVGADLAQLGGLLENAQIVAALDRRQRRGKTTQAGARDQDVSHFCAPGASDLLVLPQPIQHGCDKVVHGCEGVQSQHRRSLVRQPGLVRHQAAAQ
jgi:hypothetical protein